MSKKKGLVKVLPLLFVYLSLHSLDSRLKEEINQVLIRSFGADTTQVIAVCTFALLGDDDNGMPLHMKDVVSEKSSQPTIAIPERMQVFIKTMEACRNDHGVDPVGIQCRLSRLKQLRHPSDQLLMVAKEGVPSCHIRIGVFTSLGTRMLVGNG